MTTVSTTTSSTWITTSTSPPSTITVAGSVDYGVSGAWVIRIDRASGTSRPWVHLNHLPELADFDAYGAELAVAPDGSVLAISATGYPLGTGTGFPGSAEQRSPRSELYLASTERPDEVRRADTGLTDLGPVAFSPDSRWLAVVGDSTLSLVSVDGATSVRASTTDPLPYPHELTWSPDGRSLSVLNLNNRGAPWTVTFDVDPANGTARNVPR
ncbi:hypothetical protein [Dermatobacter hominis]|uniref:hypothetical protein n=1 Tax=Dermatobacter hominis TaxID=2884263 RepID=UPI001D0F9E18|nr:hypothetical protein [Dermatobacter hominis]UDY35845.1 hypothetical protein LH044_21320 [Dermatobacter hominis]